MRQFRMDRRNKKLSSWCRDCEVQYGIGIKSNVNKHSILQRIRKNWAEIAAEMNEKEVDQQLFELRDIWNKKREK